MDLAFNNLQRLICHKTKQTKPNQDKTVRVVILVTVSSLTNFFSVKNNTNDKILCWTHYEFYVIWTIFSSLKILLLFLYADLNYFKLLWRKHA